MYVTVYPHGGMLQYAHIVVCCSMPTQWYIAICPYDDMLQYAHMVVCCSMPTWWYFVDTFVDTVVN